MLAIFLAPVYILANVFTAYWLLRWMKEVHPLFRHPAVLGVIWCCMHFLHFPC